MSGPSQSGAAVVAQELGICYDLRLTSHLTLRASFNEWLRGLRARPRDTDWTFWALHGVSFTLPAGEILGVMGRNGSGKSTLLLTIAGILRPDRGRIATFGRTSALLSLGAGFEAEATGLENLYLNAAFLGLSRRQIETRLDEIVDFSELGQFIDAPLRTYSSGMRQRLGFAIAAHSEPDILLLDEVLSVGDAAFQAKCVAKLGELIGRARAIIVVSHQPKFLAERCSKALWLHEGTVAAYGDPRETVNRYTDALASLESPVRQLDAATAHLRTVE